MPVSDNQQSNSKSVQFDSDRQTAIKMGELYSFNMSPGERQGCWNRRSGLEKFFIIFNGILFIAVGILAVLALLYTNYILPNQMEQTAPVAAELIHNQSVPAALEPESVDSHSICLTPGCVRAAATMLTLMDDTVEPCDDFYQFACGSFVRDTVISDDRAGVNIFSEIVDILQVQIRTLIAEPVDEAHEIRPVRMAKQLYAACLNQTHIEERGLKPTLEWAERFGGWPVLAANGSQWNADGEWSWVETLKKLGRHGFGTGSIFTLSVQTDLLNSSVRTLDMDQTTLGIDEDYLLAGLDDPITQAYYKYMLSVAEVLGANRTEAELQLKEALLFEIELAKIGLPKDQRRNASALHNPMQLHEIQAAYPVVGSWLDYIAAFLPSNIEINANETIVVTVPTFYAQLGALMAATPNRTVANYLMWRAVEQIVIYGPDSLRDLQHAFEREQSGQQEKTARWQECIDTTSQSLPISLAALYVRKFFKDSAKVSALDMVSNIRQQFEDVLTAVPWMDEETRAEALLKMRAMAAHIGYPNELGDDAALTGHYRDLEVDSERYLESVLSVNVFETNYEFGQLRLPVNKTDWVRHAKVATLNALYRPTQNSISFPAGILQGRFFGADRPAYLNYGAIGFVIGHEITHGFDDKGRQFNALGNVHEWWQPETRDKFLSRAECIVHQFGNYTEKTTNLTLNGLRTQGENIADSGGAKIAYNAYKNWARENAAEGILPALPYNQQQLFWISAAQNWCSVMKSESISWTITTDYHSPDVFRVLGPLRNSAEFAKDFSCPSGSGMNPDVKCGMW